jgi:hypothetical protein
MLDNTHDHKNTMGRPRKKITHTEHEDDPPRTDKQQTLNKTKQGPPTCIIGSLRKARAMGIQRLLIKIDSHVVAGHIGEAYKARDLDL